MAAGCGACRGRAELNRRGLLAEELVIKDGGAVGAPVRPDTDPQPRPDPDLQPRPVTFGPGRTLILSPGRTLTLSPDP